MRPRTTGRVLPFRRAPERVVQSTSLSAADVLSIRRTPGGGVGFTIAVDLEALLGVLGGADDSQPTFGSAAKSAPSNSASNAVAPDAGSRTRMAGCGTPVRSARGC